MTIQMRAETPGDADAIERVHREAFGGEAEAALVRALRESTPPGSFISWVACEGAEVVAHVLLSPMEIRAADTTQPALALAPLAVRPRWQRRAVGSSLTAFVLEIARAADHTCVLVLGDPGYYGRFGFEPAGRFAIEPPDPSWAPNYGVLPLTDADPPEGMAVYPPAFEGL